MSATHDIELTEQEPNKRKKRALVILAAVVAASGVGTLAYGYWTESGAGTGGATAATTSALTVNQTSTVTGLYPGSTPQGLSGNFDNPNTSQVTLTSVTASVSDVQKGGVSIAATCDPSNFSIAGTGTVGGGGVVPAGSAKGSWSGLTIQLLDTSSNQDACKGASPVISYSAS